MLSSFWHFWCILNILRVDELGISSPNDIFRLIFLFLIISMINELGVLSQHSQKRVIHIKFLMLIMNLWNWKFCCCSHNLNEYSIKFKFWRTRFSCHIIQKEWSSIWHFSFIILCSNFWVPLPYRWRKFFFIMTFLMYTTCIICVSRSFPWVDISLPNYIWKIIFLGITFQGLMNLSLLLYIIIHK